MFGLGSVLYRASMLGRESGGRFCNILKIALAKVAQAAEHLGKVDNGQYLPTRISSGDTGRVPTCSGRLVINRMKAKFNFGVSFRYLVPGHTRQCPAQKAATESDTDSCLARAVLV